MHSIFNLLIRTTSTKTISYVIPSNHSVHTIHHNRCKLITYVTFCFSAKNGPSREGYASIDRREVIIFPPAFNQPITAPTKAPTTKPTTRPMAVSNPGITLPIPAPIAEPIRRCQVQPLLFLLLFLWRIPPICLTSLEIHPNQPIQLCKGSFASVFLYESR